MSTFTGNDYLHKRENEAKLLEASAIGNLEDVKKLVEAGVDVNSQNIINHWTPLHWACKRGHRSIVSYLLKHQADQSLETINHETCWQLASEPDFSVPFTGKVETKHKKYMQKDKEVDKTKEAKPAFTPNYLANPSFPFISSSSSPSYDNNSDHHYINDSSDFYAKSKSEATSTSNDLVLKVKMEEDKDFIEMDLSDVSKMTYNSLLSSICKELECSGEVKLRKLPNTIIRNDRDITRLTNYQEIEVFFT